MTPLAVGKPSIRELLDEKSPEDSIAHCELAERVEAVLRLHTKRGSFCKQCSQAYDEGGIGWPCPTIRALEGQS